jgi:predicted nucleotidyltransferase
LEINREIYDFIDVFKNALLEKCGNIIGIYLFGSLTYGGFNEKSSDIDLLVITKTLLHKTELENVKNIHKKLDEMKMKWAKRFEVSYTPVNMFSKKTVPVVPRPYYNEIFYDEATYGNEWLINNYLLINYGKTIYGPDFKTLIKYKITIDDIKRACIDDFYKEWVPKINDDEWLSNSHNQSYIVLNICRIMYTIFNSGTENKQKSANWAKEQYREWKNMIEEAVEWDYTKTMNKQDEIKELIRYMERILDESGMSPPASKTPSGH